MRRDCAGTKSYAYVDDRSLKSTSAAELEKALEEIDSPEPSFHKGNGTTETNNTTDAISDARSHRNNERQMLKSSSQTLTVDESMHAMFGEDHGGSDNEASSTEYTSVNSFDHYISGAAVRSKPSPKTQQQSIVSEFDFVFACMHVLY